MSPYHAFFLFFFFNDTATTEIYTLSLHDALPIFVLEEVVRTPPSTGSTDLIVRRSRMRESAGTVPVKRTRLRSEEHTSELQSRLHLVCRLLLEKKKQTTTHTHNEVFADEPHNASR